MYFTLLLSIIWIMSVDSGYQKTDFLKYHNYYRSKETRAINMTKMHWDSKLADKASRVAKRCVMAHSPRSFRKSNKYSYVGENLYFTSGSGATAGNVVKAWYSEKQYYNFRDHSCKSRKVCGHYTQVVWAKSEALGCFVAKCNYKRMSWNGGRQGLKDPFHLGICLYGPGGNYRGVRPYKIKPGSNGQCYPCCYGAKQRFTSSISVKKSTILQQTPNDTLDASDDDSVHADSHSHSLQNEVGGPVETRVDILTKANISSDGDD